MKTPGKRPNRLALEEHKGQTPENQHAGQGHDEGRNFQIGDPITLKGPNCRTDQQTDANSQNPIHLISNHENARERAHHSDHGTNRKVNPTGNDDQQHSQSHGDDITVLQYQVGNIHRTEEDAAGLHLEEEHNRDQRDQHAVFANIVLKKGCQGFHYSTTSCSVIMYFITLSCEASLAGNSPTMRPSRMM